MFFWWWPRECARRGAHVPRSCYSTSVLDWVRSSNHFDMIILWIGYVWSILKAKMMSKMVTKILMKNYENVQSHEYEPRAYDFRLFDPKSLSESFKRIRVTRWAYWNDRKIILNPNPRLNNNSAASERLCAHRNLWLLIYNWNWLN